MNLSPNEFIHYTYSRKCHLEVLSKYSNDLYGKTVDFQFSDLKRYQDLLVYCFIKENIPQGSKILEIGGSNSRILKKLSNSYECWNIDKFEGIGHGPTVISEHTPYHLILDYIGNHNLKLPSDYFDFVFSISVLEHIQKDEELFQKILTDINRVLSPSGYSLHCLDSFLQKYFLWINPLLKYLFENANTYNDFVSFEDISKDNSIYVMTPKSYNKYWRGVVHKEYNELGKPFSYNILWKK